MRVAGTNNTMDQMKHTFPTARSVGALAQLAYCQTALSPNTGTRCLVTAMAACVCLLLLSPNANGQVGGTKNADDGLVDPGAGANMSWTVAAWNGDEYPYLAASARVGAASRSSSFASFVADCKMAAEKDPSNKIDAFTFAYATWVAGVTAKSNGALDDMTCDTHAVVNRDDITDTYDGARIRFLYEVKVNWVPSPRLIPLGERLLRHTANDVSVMVKLADLYKNELKHGNRGTESRCIELCNRAISLEPDNRMPYGGLAACYDALVDYCDNWRWRDGIKMTPEAQSDQELANRYLQQYLFHTTTPGRMTHGLKGT